MNLSEPFIRRPVMTAVLTLSVILFGILAYIQLPVNDLPAVDYPVIQVIVGYPGASPDTIANTIATPFERQFMQINGLEVVTSKSTQGVATFTLQFALDKNIDAAATDVQTAISQASGSLPADLPSPPTYSKSNPNDQPIMYIALTSDSVTPGQLYDYASTQVGQRISILPGVSRVNVFGTKSAIRIKARPAAMWARGITMDDLSAAIKAGTSYTGAGQLDSSSGTAILRPQGQLETADQYNNLIVGGTNGVPVYLRDVATAIESVQDERINMRFWVRGYEVPSATVIVAVNRRAGANAVEVSKSIREVLPEISSELPGSIRVTPIYDRSQSIVNSVVDVETTLVIAFVLVVIVIFAFLGRATDTLIPTVALPLSLLITFVAMRFLGYSLDNLSLMALTLAIGFLVDDAIVFLENTVRRMERGEQPFEAAISSAREISFTIMSMTISLAAVFIPLVFMTGLVGRIFREFAITIVIAIFASGLVSLTLTPLMSARLLQDRGPGSKKTWMERVIGGVEKRVLGSYGRRDRVPARQHGAHLHVPEAAEGARADRAGGGAADGKDQLGAGRDGVPASFSGARDLDRRHEPEPGAVRVRRLRRQSRPGLRDGREAHGQVPRVSRVSFGLLGLLREHAEPGCRDPARPGEDVRGLRGADPDALSERVLAELSLPDQEAGGPVPGDPGGPGFRARGAGGPLAPLHQVGRREEP